MKAIEFEAVSKNGIIEIPKQYTDFIDSKLKIVLMKEDLDKDYKNNESEINAFIELEKFNYENTKNLRFDEGLDIDNLMSDINEVKL
jgi:hypothetical protein